MTTVFSYLRKEFLTLALLAGAAIYSMGGQGGAINAVNLSPESAMQSSYHSVMAQSPIQGIRSAVRAHVPSINGFGLSSKGGSSRSFALGSSGPIFLN